MPVAWLVLFLSNVVVGDGQEAWQMLLRTVPSRGTSRLGQYWQKSFVDVFNTNCSISRKAIPFLTVSIISYSWMASTAPQADSWWPGHVEPHDVVIADIAGQALDIFLHGPESAHKNGIAKTFTHTSILIHPCTLLKETAQTTTAKCSTHQTWCLHLHVLFLSSVLVGDFQDVWHLLHFRGLVA